ncbi:MAG: glycosyltransferase family 2 protein [Opitutaceae bacterium]|nr:glycosyltransferase family 2 protein [Cytophagales bacterium]
MKVLAIIVTYNGAQWIQKCISSLMENTLVPEILIVDNASTDNTLEIVSKDFPTVEIIKSRENLGFGKANNIGLKKALEEQMDYAFLLNQDAWADPNTIEKLIEVAEKNRIFGVLCPMNFLPGKKELEWYFSCYIGAEKCPGFVSDLACGQVKDIYSLPFVNAAAWLVSRACIEEVGGFDPIFPHYGEDEDYCMRVLYKQLKVGIVPGAEIVHDINFKSWDQIKVDPIRQRIINFIELKNLNNSFRFLKFNFVKSRLERLSSLLLTRRLKEFKFMSKIMFSTIRLIPAISHSRKVSKQKSSFLK